MFNFPEAERRVRLGNNCIRRDDWEPQYALVHGSVHGSEYILQKNLETNIVYLLTQEDLDASDWIDPGENNEQSI